MKKLFLTTMILVSMVLGATGLNAQTVETQLNQIELHKQYLGTWRSQFKDTIAVVTYTAYGKGSMQSSCKVTTKGKVIYQCHQLWAYDKNSDKMLGMHFEKSSPSVSVYLCGFTSKNENETVQLLIKDPSHIEKGNELWKDAFKSKDLFIQTYLKNNKTVSVRTFMRVK